MRYQGRVTTWKDDRGFGFITPDDSQGQVLVHISSFANRQRRPTGNERVSYELKVDGTGRSQAAAVRFIGEQSGLTVPSARTNAPALFTLAFFGFVVYATFAGRLPYAVPAFYVIASVTTFFAYLLDKSAASRREWRTKESTLHMLSLLGGWPGAIAAQRLLRHKSAKTPFQFTFWWTVVLNCAVLGWLYSRAGA